jgi:hypothetical protein
MSAPGRPLILTAETERIPPLVRLRDAGLTALLWLGCGAMWAQLFPEVELWLEARGSEDIDYHLPPIAELLVQGGGFIACLLAAYFVWSFRTWRHAERDLMHPVPLPLDPATEAGHYRVTPAEVEAMRLAPSLTVLTHADGTILRWRDGPPDPPPPQPPPRSGL